MECLIVGSISTLKPPRDWGFFNVHCPSSNDFAQYYQVIKPGTRSGDCAATPEVSRKTPENSHYLRWYDLRHGLPAASLPEHFL